MKRRTMLAAMGAGWVSALTMPGAGSAFAQARSECGPLTPANAEGPFYRRVRSAWAPETETLNADGRLIISGRVQGATCGPARNGVIEVWQANEEGEYDLQGFRDRGVVRCDADGQFSFRTVRPGHYLNGRRYRPAHIHVKVHADGRPTLTTQLYFAGDPYNASDAWFRDSLLLRDAPTGCSAPNPARPQHKHFAFVV